MTTEHRRAMELFSEGKIAAAKELFSRVLVEENGNAEARYKLAICEFRLKNFPIAQQSFQAITSADPEHAEAWYYLGLCCERQGDTEAAHMHYRFALAAKPDFAEAQHKLGANGSTVPPGRIAGRTSEGDGVKATRDVSQGTVPRPGQAVFTTKEEDGPGRLLYGPSRRRVSSMSEHVIILAILFVGMAVGVWLALVGGAALGGAVVGALFLLSAVGFLVHMLLHAYFTKYLLYERRLEVKSGILFRTHVSIWLFEITKIDYTRNPMQLLTRNASLRVQSDKEEVNLVGLKSPTQTGSLAFSEALFEELRNAVRDQRGTVKKIWI